LGAVDFQHHAVVGCPHPSDGGNTVKSVRTLYRRVDRVNVPARSLHEKNVRRYFAAY